MLLNSDFLFLILFFISFFSFFFHPYIFSPPHPYTFPYIYLHSFFDFLFFQFLSSRLQNISPLLPLSFFLILLHTHTHTQISLPLSHTNKFSLIHTQITGREVEIGVLHRLAFYIFFVCFGLISFILLFRFHQAYKKDCFCVSNLSIGFCVFVLIVVCFSL